MTERNPLNWSKAEIVSRDSTTEWLTDAEMLNQLNMFGDTSQITLLKQYDLAVRSHIENYLGAAIFEQSWTAWYGSGSDDASPMYLDIPTTPRPAASALTVNNVKAYSTSGLVTIDPSGYSYDLTGNCVILTTLPSLNRTIANPIQVSFTVSQSPVVSDPVVLQAGLMLLTHFYNNRSAFTDKQQYAVPMGFDTLLRPYKPLVM